MAIITVKQASQDYFNGAISESKLYELVRKKEIPVLTISSKKIFFNTKKLDEWLDGMNSMTSNEDTGYGTLRMLQP